MCHMFFEFPVHDSRRNDAVHSFSSVTVLTSTPTYIVGL